jgi:hypothetical protein
MIVDCNEEKLNQRLEKSHPLYAMPLRQVRILFFSKMFSMFATVAMS